MFTLSLINLFISILFFVASIHAFYDNLIIDDEKRVVSGIIAVISAVFFVNFLLLSGWF